ncbi:MAG: FHA domain-containing protein, partial [Planctomycetota bacterium]
MFRLTIRDSNNTAKRFKVNKSEILIGRHKSCDIAIPEKSVSSQHAKIFVQEGEMILEDLNSANGVFVNGRKIKQRIQLKEED